MNRPTVKKYEQPTHIDQYPTGPCFVAGHLVTINAGWRTEKSVVEGGKCIGCYQCYLVCPEGVIFKSEGIVDIDYDFCKGCGICARICPKDAIKMIKEIK
jgi:pyruvate ferredoxin oxidoreductase delta subunit